MNKNFENLEGEISDKIQRGDNINKKDYLPFVSEVEEFNTLMGKEWQNRKSPYIDPKDADFVVNFTQEELDEMKEAIAKKDIVGILDAVCDLLYVAVGNATLVFGLKDKLIPAYNEVQASNLSKVCNTLEEAEETVKVRSEQQGEPCHYEEINGKYVVYRTRDMKVMKNINYFSPNLKQFFTEDEIKNCTSL